MLKLATRQTRTHFRQLVDDGIAPDAAVRELARSAVYLPVEDWSQLVAELHQAHHQAQPIAA